MISVFRTSLERSGLVGRGTRLLLAVSGGSDSVGLLHLFHEVSGALELKLAVAHYNHRFRGEEADGDALFVQKLAGELTLPFYLGTSPRRGRQGLSPQEAARRERLAFLLATAGRRKCRAAAFGHTADDQAETVLMRFLLEGGPAGLGGIPPASHDGRIIHPLLALRREEIRSWLRKKGISWREDRSNESHVYRRNTIRRDLIPLLADAYNPRIVDRLAALATYLRRDEDLLEGQARQLLAGVKRGQGRSRFPAALLAGAPPALLARALLAELRALAPGDIDLTGRHIETLLGGRSGGGFSAMDLPGGIMAGRDRTGLTLYRPGRAPVKGAPFHSPLDVPGTAFFQRGTARVTSWLRRRQPRFSPRALSGAPWRTALDRERIVPPLTVRSRQPGDRLRLLGAPGTRKLKESLIDAGVPLLLRDRLPLVCDAEGIIWVGGLRPAHRCRVTAGTKRLLFLEAQGDFRADF